jgi:hypothetical protein
MNRATQIMQLELRIPVSDAAHAIREARERAGRHGDASNHTDGSLIILTQSMNSRGSRSESSKQTPGMRQRPGTSASDLDAGRARLLRRGNVQCSLVSWRRLSG